MNPRPCQPIRWSIVIVLLAVAPTLASDVPTDANASKALAGSTELFSQAIAKSEPFVVQIETVGGVQPLNRGTGNGVRLQGDGGDEQDTTPAPFRENLGSGFLVADGPTTGIIYDGDGLILTSSFNFVREPSIVTVRLADGRQLPATIVGRDKVRKLTLLKIEATGLPTPEWTPREQIRPGQWAVAVGRGFGGTSNVSVGIVSAIGRMMGNAIQTDANLSPANYGGPLLDAYGRVLGICVPMAQRPGELAGIEFYDAGIGFAVPGWRVREIAEHLRQGENFYRGWLGMTLNPKAKHGVQIRQTADPSPMRAAGAEPGDFITAINGKDIKHFGQLSQATYMLPAGEAVKVKLLRGSEEFEVTVTLARNTELGNLPEVEEPFDPTQPATEEPPPAPFDED